MSRLESAMTRPLKAVSAFITKGATPTTYGFQWEQSGVPFLRSECVSTHGLDMKQAMYISPEADAALQRSRVREGDILMTITGYVGRVIRLTGLPTANINQHIARIRINDDSFESRFVYHYLSQPWIKANYETITTGQAYPQISLTQVRDTEIPALPIYEQKAIANALDTADDLIASLERLITKKRDIKQGMMQELLTGRSRLPGFSGEWTRVTAGEIGVFKGGSGFPMRHQGRKSGQYPFFKVSDMNIPGNRNTLAYANNYISEPVRSIIGATAFPAGAIIFAKVGAAVFLERKRVLSAPSCIDNNMAALIINPSVADTQFIHHALLSFPLSSLVAVGALPSLNGSQLRSIPIDLPRDLAEQRAISGVLGDADAEIAALERRLKSTRAIKQGMMQELLTGRTRLPVEEEVSV